MHSSAFGAAAWMARRSFCSAARWSASSGAKYSSMVVGLLLGMGVFQALDVDLLHLQHDQHDVYRFYRVLVVQQLTQDRRDNLPSNHRNWVIFCMAILRLCCAKRARSSHQHLVERASSI